MSCSTYLIDDLMVEVTDVTEKKTAIDSIIQANRRRGNLPGVRLSFRFADNAKLTKLESGKHHASMYPESYMQREPPLHYQ